MFESEDWNFDEELLQDADDKAMQFFSQVGNEEVETPAKKRKLDDCRNTDILTTKTLNKVDTDNTSRKNFVLGIFQQNSQQKDEVTFESKNQQANNISQNHCFNNISQNNITFQRLNGSKLENDSSLQASRKNIVLDILKKKNVYNVTDNSNKLTSSISGITSLHSDNQKSEARHSTTLQKSSSYPQSMHKSPFFQENETNSSNIPFKMKHYNQEANINEKHHGSSEKLIKKDSTNWEEPINKNINNNKQDLSKESRARLLMEHLKPSTSSNEGYKNNTKPASFASKTEKQSNKKMTLVRKFPGPAGLLPDVIDSSMLSTSYLEDLEDNESDHVQDKRNTSLTEYCSQDTKTLFSEGAWQRMLDDLPPGFLKNYEIAEIKEIASENQQQCTKIPFLAGIIENIDYSHENPPIILKDFTDRIEGIIHANIPMTYPGALDKNVVILLQNVGLLSISGTFVIHKYHILISPSNLLAIYSHKGNIIRTPQMELLRKEFGTIRSTSMELNVQQNDSFNALQYNLNDSSAKQKENLSSDKDHCNGTYESLHESYNSDMDVDSLLFSVDVKEFAMKGNKENISNNETSDTSTKYSKDLESNCGIKTNNSNKKENIPIKSKLSAFRCQDALMEVESNFDSTNVESVSQNNETKSKDKERHWVENVLCDSDNDSDDELLSQLDVDNIF